MRSRIYSLIAAAAMATAVTVLVSDSGMFARGGGRGGGGARGGGGGAARASSGSFSRPSGGSSYSRPSTGGGGNYSRPSQLPSNSGNVSRPAQLPSSGGSGSGGRMPNRIPAPPSAGGGGSVAQLPSNGRPGAGAANRPAQLPAKPGAGTGARPGGGGIDFAGGPSQLPARPGGKPGVGTGTGDRGSNFLGSAAGGAAAGMLANAAANRPGQLPAERPKQRPTPPNTRPQDRPNWGEWSSNRGDSWQKRVNNSNQSWKNWEQNKQDRLNDFHQNQQQRWNNLSETRKDWQHHREDLWNYRADRAEQIRDKARDYYNNYFDDRWWAACGWGGRWVGVYPRNPWWWWATATLGATAAFVDSLALQPVYIDYGFDDSTTVVLNDEPVPADLAESQVTETAANMEQPPPPLPPEEGGKAEWMALGVFALTQQEHWDPVMFLQLSVSREGKISGAYSNTLSQNNRPVAGLVDKTSQRVAWRIGDNQAAIFETTVANLTLDVAPVAVHFNKTQTQNWLLVRLPEPAPDGAPATIPEISHAVPGANKGK